MILLSVLFLLLIANPCFRPQAIHAQIPGILTAQSQKLEAGKVEQQLPSTASVLKYENPSYGIKMQYPTGWNKTELNINGSNGNEAANKDNSYIRLVSFHSPYENNSDAYSEGLYLTVDNLPSNNIPLVEYTKAKINSLEHSFTNFRLIGSYSTSLAGNNRSHEIIFLGNVASQGNANLKMMEVYAIKGVSHKHCKSTVSIVLR
jgi:hypothetical protein